MATATPNLLQPPNFTCVKSLSESSALTSIPSSYTFTTDPNQLLAFEPQHSIPIIDFSLLTSGDADQRSRAIQDLDQACLEWGFFMLINHGVPESLMTGMIEACRGFFDLAEEEKREFQGTHVLSPVRCGTSFNARVDQILFWRDFLKLFVHPQFHSPSKPAGFSEVCLEYTQRMRKVAGELLKGISKSLGLEEWYIDKTMNMDSGLQILTVNLYPPCPQPEYAMGMPPHSDHSFLTILIQNGIGGLQVQHKGQWFDVNPIPNSILVNTGDHLELINHGVPESLMTGMIEACRGFFDLTEEEKREFQGTHVLSPIRCGTSFNARVDQILFWRDFLKVFVHPQFHSPSKPAGFSEVCLQYTQRMRKVAGELLKGISKSLGLEEWYIDKTMNMDSGLQILTVNLYPPCPQPEYAMGLPPHSDHSFLTILIQNGIGGLQVQHKGQWFNVNPIPNSILVNTGDHLEVLSNGKYKSVLHRAVVNNKTTRISLVLSNGPSLDTVVEPVPELSHPLTYVGMAYKEYLELQQGNKLDGKTSLDRVRIRTM